MKKKRLLTKKIKKAHRQGSSKAIAKWFLTPLLHYRPEHMGIRDWLDYLFGTSYRDIYKYTAVKSFDIKGTAMTKFGVRTSSWGFRKIKVGDECFVRTDTRTPDRIDMEVLIGVGKRSRVFELTKLQWAWTQRYLEKV